MCDLRSDPQFAEYGRTRRDLARAEAFFGACTACNATENSRVQPSVHGDAVVAVLCAVGSLNVELKENLAIKLTFLTQSSKKFEQLFMQLL